MKIRFLVLIALGLCAPALAQETRAPLTEIDIDPDGTIFACAQKENGQLRVVEGPDDCRPSEVALSWNDSEPAPPPPQCCKKEMQFVGFSTRSVQGTGGILRMNLACQETFARSRICNSKEIVETTVLPSIVGQPIPPGGAQPGWVRPSAIVGRGANIGIETTVAMQADVENFSCRGWITLSSSGIAPGTGLSMNQHGQFLLSSCTSTIKVACCAVIDEAKD